MTENPPKKYELFWLTVGSRLPSATNSTTLRAGRYRFIPVLRTILQKEIRQKSPSSTKKMSLTKHATTEPCNRLERCAGAEQKAAQKHTAERRAARCARRRAGAALRRSCERSCERSWAGAAQALRKPANGAAQALRRRYANLQPAVDRQPGHRGEGS